MFSKIMISRMAALRLLVAAALLLAAAPWAHAQDQGALRFPEQQCVKYHVGDDIAVVTIERLANSEESKLTSIEPMLAPV